MKKEKAKKVKAIREMTNKEIIAERFQYLVQKYGELTPGIVVTDAKDPKSPLHKRAGFEWDDSRAADIQRLDHARHLIASINYIVRRNHTTHTAVAYVRNPRKSPREQGYVATEDAAKDPKLAREIVDMELDLVMAHFERIKELSAVLRMEARVVHFIRELQKFAAQVAA